MIPTAYLRWINRGLPGQKDNLVLQQWWVYDESDHSNGEWNLVDTGLESDNQPPAEVKGA